MNNKLPTYGVNSPTSTPTRPEYTVAADTAPGLDELRLRGQVKYLRDYAISKAAEVVTASNGGNLPTREQLSSLIAGIDGNIAVAGERAVAQATGTTQGDAREGGGE